MAAHVTTHAATVRAAGQVIVHVTNHVAARYTTADVTGHVTVQIAHVKPVTHAFDFMPKGLEA